ncbi:hypothetical protein PR202_gb16216 [Eleusine coracana subsp. coracana]|uniref:Uncharacterized protein n=1 Tax=Eleusine coracana subsp. coracana TaxID=191504 RepID=A0AAV5EZV1_ELECO|nr:hypothetical protein PR202_gb16216 [Eleusine coracana subsp. coracana]
MLYFHNIRMSQESKQLDLTKYASCIRHMFKDVIYLFDRDLITGVSIEGRTNNTITPFSYDFFYLIPVSLTILGEKIHSEESTTEKITNPHEHCCLSLSI